MRAFTAFIKKELCEASRTYKLMIMLLVFFLLGIMGPFTAKLTPELLKSLDSDQIKITITETTAKDSWLQFYKNVPQMGLIVLIIVFSGIMAGEFTKGTLINMLTKGLSRRIVVFAKLASASLLWTVSYLLCFAVSYFYTEYFWPDGEIFNLAMALLTLWLYGEMLIVAVLFGGVLFKNTYGALLFTGLLVAVMYIINIIPEVSNYNPASLTSCGYSLITGESSAADSVWQLVSGTSVTILMLIGTISVFDKKQL